MKGQLINRLLNILIILMIVIILGIGYEAVTVIRHELKPTFTSSNYLWQVETAQYDTLIEAYYRDIGFYQKDDSENNQALKSLADYAEAAFWEHAFRIGALPEKAEQEAKRKEEAASKLGIFSNEKDKIDQLYAESAKRRS